ncbi:hypothetical protein EDB84DRAFT_1440708 [Lactarius hengduanensis]|nr:hypothetical protein EDB84DRAFT_1440708 [Lactarius hengduanensis]
MWALVRSGSPHGHHNDSGGSASLKWVAYELMKAWSTVAWKATEVPARGGGCPRLVVCPLLVGLLPRAVLLEGRQLYVFDPSWGGASACLGCFELFVSWGPYQHNTEVTPHQHSRTKGVCKMENKAQRIRPRIQVPAEIGA